MDLREVDEGLDALGGIDSKEIKKLSVRMGSSLGLDLRYMQFSITILPLQ